MTTAKKSVGTVAASFLTAAALALVMPGTSFAINKVDCKQGENYLQIWSHSSSGQKAVTCYANAGSQSFDNWWIDKVSTGNNKFSYRDDNGAVVDLDRHQTKYFPNRPPKVSTITIH